MREAAFSNIVNRLRHQLHRLPIFDMVPGEAVRRITASQSNLLVRLPEIASMVELHIVNLNRLRGMWRKVREPFLIVSDLNTIFANVRHGTIFMGNDLTALLDPATPVRWVLPSTSGRFDTNTIAGNISQFFELGFWNDRRFRSCRASSISYLRCVSGLRHLVGGIQGVSTLTDLADSGCCFTYFTGGIRNLTHLTRYIARLS